VSNQLITSKKIKSCAYMLLLFAVQRRFYSGQQLQRADADNEVNKHIVVGRVLGRGPGFGHGWVRWRGGGLRLRVTG